MEVIEIYYKRLMFLVYIGKMIVNFRFYVEKFIYRGERLVVEFVVYF